MRGLAMSNDSVKAWIKYKCGCCEGIWQRIDKKCPDHNQPVVAYSNTVDLKPPDDFKEIINE